MPNKLRKEREAAGISAKVPARGRRVPAKVKEAVLQEVAAHPDIDGRGVVANIAKGWGLDPATVRGFMKDPGTMAELRTVAAGRCFELALHAQERMKEDLSNDEKMEKTSLKDKAFSLKAASDAGVNILEGVPKNNTIISFGELKKQILILNQYDQGVKGKTALTNT